ncbi:NADPH:quinone oxidoreductase family protein [Pseudofrankia inefficax]|uniref:Alcohol dehydrogenase zinc-binding domain protein n=1 Tax=Pseudofrankia inefficax (strain DSM 45817 / CECT 9037 / DDB 130130 / EuI1c) TaxID=298654 RepID=E3J9L0_PSEI1|nr:NADPH:quinone oxidoreductase family protein [Pseudofrankia inefficax]ADP83374.1 Alcohol dehydrogenase zinc-binding domain protein [Pseudofrankia inefficax]
MKAAVCVEYGGPEVIEVKEIDTPPVGPDQVRVGVRAAAVNFPDVLVIANTYQVKAPVPFVPGSEFAGVVEEVGADVTGLAPGDRVAGTVFVGAFAEQVVCRPESLRPIPDGVDDRSAAAFVVAHRTSYHVLRSMARVQPGERVVVLGAGGGVGLAAVQLAVALGAEVTAVANAADKLQIAAANGATTLLDNTVEDLRKALKVAHPDGVDVVVDMVGGDLSEAALRALRFDGRFVTVGYASGTIPRIPLNLVLLKGAHIMGFQMRDFATHRPDELARDDRELTELLSSGKVRPYIGSVFDLDDTAGALRHVADGKAIGKVVLDVAP